ncbi:hypothetical protein [Indioceanicola profundi]|uniref:hypothetical protein n=1 Tax=Indioceanicola profundi TaxID=2220096 RepID=UPI000E6AD593|nr:hypothetical protein [Indioceanicola profundi]
MRGLRFVLASALLATGLVSGSAAASAACAPLPPEPNPLSAEAVERYLASGQTLMACLLKEFEASREGATHHERAQLVAEMNALEYRLEQVRLDASAAARNDPTLTQSAEVSLTATTAR